MYKINKKFLEDELFLMLDVMSMYLKVDMKCKFLFSDMIVQAKLERRLLTVF